MQNLKASLEVFKIDLREYTKPDLLYKDPVRPITPVNHLLSVRADLGNPATMTANFEAANYDIGRELAVGLQIAAHDLYIH